MNRLEIERGHWVERYLAGRLSEAETRSFEAYWVEHPDLIRDIEATARLKSGLAQLRARGELARLLRPSWWPGGLRLLSIAACMALAVVGLATWRAAQAPAATMLAAAAEALPDLDGAVLPRGDVVTVMRLRSATPVDAVIELPAVPRAIELRVLPETDLELPAVASAARYDVSLAEIDEAGALRSPPARGHAVADPDGFVSVFIDSRTLHAARYRLLLEPSDRPGVGAGAGFVVDVRDVRGAAP